MYTGIPGAGLFAISRDLETWSLLGTDDRLKSNIHGLCCFEQGGEKRIALAQNDEQRVLILDATDGKVLQVLGQPRGGEFKGCAEANGYYSARRSHVKGDGNPNVFSVTDVTFLEGKLYVVTGYVVQGSLAGQGKGEERRRPLLKPCAAATLSYFCGPKS